MMTHLYAIDKIKKLIVCNTEIISNDWCYKSEIKKRNIFGKEKIIQEAGFYETIFGGWGYREIYRSILFDEPDFVIKQIDGKINIYQKRYLKLVFSKEYSKIYFDDSESLTKFVEEIRATYARIFNANLIEHKEQTS